MGVRSNYADPPGESLTLVHDHKRIATGTIPLQQKCSMYTRASYSVCQPATEPLTSEKPLISGWRYHSKTHPGLNHRMHI